MTHRVEIDIGGKMLTIETGRLARQAQGSATVRFGDTVVLVAACAETKPREGRGFLPLTCDYREYQYAAGRIPGGFFKREGRMSEKETITCRLMDRPLRPLFPEGYANETQVIGLVLSADTDNDPDVLTLVGASAALYLSEIPFPKPLGAVRVGLVEGRLVANPTYAEQKAGLLNIVVVGSQDAIVMVEAGAAEVSEETITDALEFGHQQILKIIAAIEELHTKLQPKKWTVTPPVVDPAAYQQIETAYGARLAEAANTQVHPKHESYTLIAALKDELLASIPEEEEDRRRDAARYFGMLREQQFRDEVLEKRHRPDGRAFDQVRQITCDTGLLPRVHGSALFTRGETQALVTVTLGTKEDVQRLDMLAEEDAKKKFMLHYNFPPFSVGEVKFMRGPGRREIGHGALAERALAALAPDAEAFPYTIRIVSDILESNGSSSMATVCGGSLALMDAGVPVGAAVGGIAMGLVLEDGKYAILTDIAGAEDHYGDMDFKVAGTEKGITALQMDIKIKGVSPEIMARALSQARDARLHVLGKMREAISEHRKELSPYAPRFVTIKIRPEKIREVIGPGGKVIRGIQEQTGAKIDIEDDGRVTVFSSDNSSVQQAIGIIQDICREVELDRVYLGKVKKVVEFGAFVEVIPGTEGLLHISQIAENRIKQVQDVVNEGDEVLVKVIEIDPSGKIRLSRKTALREQPALADQEKFRKS